MLCWDATRVTGPATGNRLGGRTPSAELPLPRRTRTASHHRGDCETQPQGQNHAGQGKRRLGFHRVTDEGAPWIVGEGNGTDVATDGRAADDLVGDRLVGNELRNLLSHRADRSNAEPPDCANALRIGGTWL